MSSKETFCPECAHRLKLGSRPHKGQRIDTDAVELDIAITGNVKFKNRL